MTNESLLHLRKVVIPEFVYGSGAMHLASRYIKSFSAKKVLLVTDPGIIRAGWVENLEQDLLADGIAYVLFHGVTPNPKDWEVMAGAEVYRDTGCDIIVAIGGGSPMDCAKGIGIVSANNGHILDFEGRSPISNAIGARKMSLENWYRKKHRWDVPMGEVLQTSPWEWSPSDGKSSYSGRA